MADNSRREQLLLKLKENLEEITAVKQVTRVQPNTLDDIRRYSTTQMPLIAAIGGVPQPKEHLTGRGPGGVDIVLSELKVDLFVYFMDNETPDSTLSSLMDDIWAKIYEDQTLGFKWCNGLTIDPKVEIAAWRPYVAFSMSVLLMYFHTTGGI